MGEYQAIPEIIFSEKLSKIGLTIPEYRYALDALRVYDLTALDQLNHIAQNRLEISSAPLPFKTTREQYQDPTSGTYTYDRQLLHDSVIKSVLGPISPLENPEFTVVAGPPGVGKTTAQKEYGDVDNSVVTDPTLIQKKLLFGFNEARYDQVTRTKEEAFDVAEKLIDHAFLKRVSIMSESTLQNLPWATKSFADAKNNNYQSRIVFIHKPLDLCFQDAIENRERPISLNYLFQSVKGYENVVHFDTFDNVSVRVIVKQDNSTKRVIYDDYNGNLENNAEFDDIKSNLIGLKSLIV